jgi:hypothetical protein
MVARMPESRDRVSGVTIGGRVDASQVGIVVDHVESRVV